MVEINKSPASLSADRPSRPGIQPEPVEDNFGLGNNHWFGHTVIQAYAQTNQPREEGKFAVKRAEHEEKAKCPGDEISVKESVGFFVERITELIVSLQYSKGGE